MPLLPLLAALAFAPSDTVRLVLVATTDVHGYVTDWDYLQNTAWPGGLARATTIVDSLRARYPSQVVLVDAGDALQGSPLAAYYGRVVQRDPHPVIETMNLMGYDAATPGSHDFDFGVDAFTKALGGSAFPWVSGNLSALPADTNLLPTYIVVTRNGVRVAITGFTTPGTMVWNGDRLRGRLRVGRIDPRVEAILRDMRKDADLAVVLMHSGLDGPSSYDTTGIGPEQGAVRLARGSIKPDLVVVGHSHGEIGDSLIGGVHFVQPRPEGRSLAVLHLTFVSRGPKLELTGVRAQRVPLDEVPPSSRVGRRLIDPHASVLGWVSTVLGETDRRMSLAASRVEDTPLLRYIHTVQRRVSRATLSAAPVLDPRAGFEQGEITTGQLFRVYPAEYTLRAIRVSGAQVRAFLELSARYFYADSTGRVAPNRFVPGTNYEVLGGAQYTIDLSRPMGSRVTRLEVAGRPVTPTDTFTLALSSYRQQGAGNFAMLAGAPVVYDKGESIRELLAADITRRHTLRADDFVGNDWGLAPAEYAQRARALFVREGGPGVAAEPPPPAPLNLPRKPTALEAAREDSIRRAQDRAEALAGVTVAALKLPAEPGAGRGLLRLLADAYRNTLRADVAIVHQEESGARLPAGRLTAAQIGAAAPGSNRLLTIKLTGDELQEVLEQALDGDGSCCELAGVRVDYDPRAKPFDRVRRVRFVEGPSLEGKRTYLLALSQRLLEGDSLFILGGSGCREGKGCRTPGRLDRWTVDLTERTAGDVLREYLRRLPQPVTPPEDRRLISNR